MIKFEKGAYLKGADLRAILEDAYLKGAILEGAILEGAILRGAIENLEDVPVIKDIHKKVYEAVTADSNTLDMNDWHICETTHCRAGWVTTVAGKEGAKLEDRIGVAAAAYAIYYKSDPDIGGPIDFFASNEVAMADIKKMAGVK